MMFVVFLAFFPILMMAAMVMIIMVMMMMMATMMMVLALKRTSRAAEERLGVRLLKHKEIGCKKHKVDVEEELHDVLRVCVFYEMILFFE